MYHINKIKTNELEKHEEEKMLEGLRMKEVKEEKHQALLKEIDENLLKIYLLDIIQNSYLRGIDHKAYTSDENHNFIKNLATNKTKQIMKNKRFKFLT